MRTWIKEELADVLIPMFGGGLDMSADVRSFVEAVRGSSCKIAGGLVTRSGWYGHLPDFDSGIYRNATVEMLRAAAMCYYAQGASCIYMFNFDCQRFRGVEEPYTEEELRALREVGDAALIARKNKRYVVAVDNLEFSDQIESSRLQLPAILRAPADQRKFSFYVGDELAAAQRDGTLKAVRLRVSIDGFTALGDIVALRLNGQEIQREDSPWPPRALMYPGALVQQGPNELVISLVKRREGAVTPLQIVGIEALLNYEAGW